MKKVAVEQASIILAFFLGGLLGAGVALLLAPQPGEETRKKIKDLAEEAGGRGILRLFKKLNCYATCFYNPR